jgi:hypothetical protein
MAKIKHPPLLIYPPEIVRGDADRPVVVFRNKVNSTDNDTHVVFPIPQSIQFSDSASYNSTEIGFSGALIVNAARSKNVSNAAANTMNALKGALPKDVSSLSQLILKSGALGNDAREVASIASSTMLNKNIVTEFTGVATRQFSFSFKLISRTKQESEIIRAIVDTFRLGLYPEGNALQLKFPPTWYINFQKNGKEIEYLPKIFETYLVSMNTNYNPSGNMFHADGSPIETEIQLSFMESRALVKSDIQRLIDRKFEEGDFGANITDSAEEINNALTSAFGLEQPTNSLQNVDVVQAFNNIVNL